MKLRPELNIYYMTLEELMFKMMEEMEGSCEEMRNLIAK